MPPPLGTQLNRTAHKAGSSSSSSSSSSSTTSSSSDSSYVYEPFPFSISHVHMDISINPGVTYVTSTLDVSAQLQSSSSNSSRGSGRNNQQMVHTDEDSYQPLVLDGREMQLMEIRLGDKPLTAEAYTLDPEQETLTIPNVPAGPFQLIIKTALKPEGNTELEGLFARHGVYATQCEADGFSRITFYPDRPDLLPLWTVRLEADAAACPVLLSNGNLQEQGQLPEGRHYAIWQNPWPTPCYLFSVVAGQLSVKKDSHTIARTGKAIPIHIYTPAAYSDKLEFAMLSIKAAMVWDEAVWGREYDLDVYTMVGIEGFNGDATETKGISIFSIDQLAASPDTHTDDEALEIQGLIGHEYFHNYSGNRVTLRDWYQLTVKEGLTVFREQTFKADMDAAAKAAGLCGPSQTFTISSNSSSDSGVAAPGPAHTLLAHGDQERALLQQLTHLSLSAVPSAAPAGADPCCTAANTKPSPSCPGLTDPGNPPGSSGFRSFACSATASWRRVCAASYLRSEQFPEDEGPLMHPIRPSSGLSRNNLYTDTVYAKGAEVVRMYQTLLGPEGFCEGVKAYFDTYDGKAVTCEDFCHCMFSTNPGSSALLPALLRWYTTPGTPVLSVKATYSPAKQTLTITTRQSNLEAEEEDMAEHPLLIPLKVGLLDSNGNDMPLHLKPTAASTGSSKKGSKGSTSSSSNLSSFRSPFIHNNITTTGLAGKQSHSMVLLVDSWANSFTFTRVPEKPSLSLLRDFSAPVRLEVEGETDKQLGFLAVHDSNAFARWDAVQRLVTRVLVRLYDVAEKAADGEGGEEAVYAALAAAPGPPPALVAALQAALHADGLDGEYKGMMLDLPGVDEVVPLLDEPDPVLLWMVKVHVGKQLAQQLQPDLQRCMAACDSQLQHIASQGVHGAEAACGFHPAAVKLRAARNAALGLLSYLDDEAVHQQCLDRYYNATCMTDRLAALECIADDSTPARDAAMAHFFDTYASQPLALHKWLWIQAASDVEGNGTKVRALMQHPAFDITSPEACEALLFGFANSVVNFHADDGSGYELMADAVMQVDRVNPVCAADLASTLCCWPFFDRDLQQLILVQLRRLEAVIELSEDVMEIVEAALPDEE